MAVSFQFHTVQPGLYLEHMQESDFDAEKPAWLPGRPHPPFRELTTLPGPGRLAGISIPLLMFQLQKNLPAFAKQVPITSLAEFITRPQAGSNWRREDIRSSPYSKQRLWCDFDMS